MGIRDVLLGKRCEMCGRRGGDVAHWRNLGMTLCTRCKRGLRAADRSQPHGSAAAGYRAGSGQPPKIAGPMGQGYRGPAPKPQRRR